MLVATKIKSSVGRNLAFSLDLQLSPPPGINLKAGNLPDQATCAIDSSEPNESLNAKIRCDMLTASSKEMGTKSRSGGWDLLFMRVACQVRRTASLDFQSGDVPRRKSSLPARERASLR